MIRYFYFSFIFFLLPNLLLAQDATSGLRGVVIDVASEAPIPYATVVLLGTDPQVGTSTDEKGRFSLENIPVGRYDLQVSCMGYAPALMPDQLINSGQIRSVEVSLKETVIALDVVELVAPKEKDKSINKMATVSARRLSVDEANRYAGGFDDPARLASSFAGVASNLTTNGIVIRGNAPKGLLWRIEGVEVSNPNHFGEVAGFGAGGITALSSQMLKDSDFFTGAFPAEYGNALSGVFDLGLRTGSNQEHQHAVQAGMIGVDVSSEGPFKKGKYSSYLFNYRYSTLGLIDVFLPNGDKLGINYQDLSFKLNFPTEKAGVFSVWGLGLVDRATSDAESDSTLWQYYEDLESSKSRISMGVMGVTHKYFIGNTTYLKTILSGSADELSSRTWNLNRNDGLNPVQTDEVYFDTWNYRLTFLANHKFGPIHTNRTGFILSDLNYDIGLEKAFQTGQPLNRLVGEKGNSQLVQVYTQSSINLGPRLTINPGVHLQYFALNEKASLEPRLGASWSMSDRENITFGYGLHSKLEKLNFYFIELPGAEGLEQPNRNLDFTKSHHIVLGYDLRTGPNSRLKVEPYYQFLFNIPVIADSSFSFINLSEDWFIREALVNDGEGRNVGVDFTLERFLNQGWYYLFTASIFDSQYKGGDGVWRNTSYNKQFLGNLLIGKEWKVGKQNLFSASGRFTFYQGDWINPVDTPASLESQDIVDDYSRTMEEQLPNSYLLHVTLTYRKNRKKVSSLWSLQILNALGNSQSFGYRYNFRDQTIDPDKETVVIPNLSYKFQF